MLTGISTLTHTAGHTVEPSATAYALIITSLPFIVFSKYVLFQHMLPQEFDAVNSIVKFDMFWTEKVSIGMVVVISSSSNSETWGNN